MSPATSASEQEALSGRFSGLAKYEAWAANRPSPAALAGARRAKKRASDLIVLALMLATTLVALLDLYLLGSGLPH